MTRHRHRFLMVASILACVLGAASATSADEQRRGTCVQSASEAVRNQYGGYDHWVYLINACGKPMACTVKTDATMQTIAVHLDVREQISVVTYQGAVESEFKATVSCHAEAR
ncbi:MAG TPA: hypothetical protein VF331_12065 [Polyangiales bacterium]